MRILENHLLAPYTTFGIGGPARYFCSVTNIDEVKQALLFARDKGIPYHVVGKGSNTLFDDRGFAGLIILNQLVYKHDIPGGIEVGAGYNFSQLGAQTARHHLSGLEFASGIPGTVGGAIFMNAGAGGKEVKDVILYVDYIYDSGEHHRFKIEDLKFNYRTSMFHEMKGVIVGGAFALTPSDRAKSDQREILDYRLKTQPYGDRTAGCCFRNPEGASAGALIDKYGLKGMRCGGAEVSTLHANFVVNRAEATCEDVLDLIDSIREKIHKESGYQLETEVRYIPYDVSS